MIICRIYSANYSHLIAKHLALDLLLLYLTFRIFVVSLVPNNRNIPAAFGLKKRGENMRKHSIGEVGPRKNPPFLSLILYLLLSNASPSFSNPISSLPAFPEKFFPAYITLLSVGMQNEPVFAAIAYPETPPISTHRPTNPAFLYIGILAGLIFLLFFMFFRTRRFQKKYLIFRKQNEELLKKNSAPHESPKTINGFSVKTNNNPFRIRDCIFIKTHERMVKIPLKDILFIKADRNYCCLHTREKEYLVVMPLKELGEKLTSKQFLRIHRSFIINLLHVDEIGTGHVVISHKTVPISKSSKKELLKHLQTI